MKIKHFEYIVIYLSVLLVCVFIGITGRLVLLGKGADEYTANVFFWICIGFGILLFAILSLFLNELVARLLNHFFKNKKVESSQNKILNRTIEEIKTEQQTIITSQQQTKIDIAIHYTQKRFALYTTDEDLKLLCDYVKMYAEKLDFENIKPIKVTDLSNLDLYHFGWNLWNHFKPIKQEGVSKLLKKVFLALEDIELDSIKSHLKDEPKKGIIKITNDLSGF
ncbi:hypothetical protein JSO59_002985 [Riemerella anatipestifer]|uniref:hypothetical protein n=1 Tax=Riemerella anatipestifer TaxID=34085 RepID=UPI0030C0AF70